MRQHVTDPTTSLLKQLQSVTLKTSSTRIPTISEVAGANHTVDVAPANQADDDEPEGDCEADGTGTGGGSTSDLPTGSGGDVIVSTGGIDLIHDYGAKPPRDEAIYGAPWPEAERYAAAFRQRLEAMLDELASRFPGGSEIFVATIFDPTDGVGDIDHVDPVLRLWKPLPLWPDGLRTLAAFNAHIREAAAARPHVRVVDVHGTLLGHGLHCRDTNNPSYHPDDPTYWLYFNLEDPNERGYDALRRAFLLEMIEVLPERLRAPA